MALRERLVTAARGLAGLLTTLRERPLVRFVLVGGFVTAVNNGLFNLVPYLAQDRSTPYVLLANAIAFTVAANIGYQLHSRITFRAGRHWRGFSAFAVVGLVGLAINTAALFLFLLPFDSNHPLALNIAWAGAAAVGALWNYQGYRLFAFGGRGRRRNRADVTA